MAVVLYAFVAAGADPFDDDVSLALAPRTSASVIPIAARNAARESFDAPPVGVAIVGVVVVVVLRGGGTGGDADVYSSSSYDATIVTRAPPPEDVRLVVLFDPPLRIEDLMVVVVV